MEKMTDSIYAYCNQMNATCRDKTTVLDHIATAVNGVRSTGAIWRASFDSTMQWWERRWMMSFIPSLLSFSWHQMKRLRRREREGETRRPCRRHSRIRCSLRNSFPSPLGAMTSENPETKSVHDVFFLRRCKVLLRMQNCFSQVGRLPRRPRSIIPRRTL